MELKAKSVLWPSRLSYQIVNASIHLTKNKAQQAFASNKCPHAAHVDQFDAMPGVSWFLDRISLDFSVTPAFLTSASESGL
jgi:hypothetical protein